MGSAVSRETSTVLNWSNLALNQTKCGVVFYYVTMAVASLSVRPAGWLDRLVMYHKHKFYNDLNKVAPVQITATIERAPPGYVDSTAWDLKAVLHLLVLIRESQTAAPVRRALRRALRPARRFMNWHQSFKAFPSLSKGYEFYYDIDTDEDYQESQVSTGRYVLEDDDVIVVGNPVEARLPSAQISVRLLRDILEARAQAGRIMPTTLRTPIPWVTVSRKVTTEAGKETVAKNGTDATTSVAVEGDSGATGGVDETTTQTPAADT